MVILDVGMLSGFSLSPAATPTDLIRKVEVLPEKVILYLDSVSVSSCYHFWVGHGGLGWATFCQTRMLDIFFSSPKTWHNLFLTCFYSVKWSFMGFSPINFVSQHDDLNDVSKASPHCQGYHSGEGLLDTLISCQFYFFIAWKQFMLSLEVSGLEFKTHHGLWFVCRFWTQTPPQVVKSPTFPEKTLRTRPLCPHWKLLLGPAENHSFLVKSRLKMNRGGK